MERQQWVTVQEAKTLLGYGDVGTVNKNAKKFGVRRKKYHGNWLLYNKEDIFKIIDKTKMKQSSNRPSRDSDIINRKFN